MARGSRKKKKAIRPPIYERGTFALASASMPTIDYPVFCLKYLVDGYTLDRCDKEQKAYFVSKLAKMAQQTWDILLTSDHWSGSGFERIPKNQIRGKLPSIITEDVEKVYVMRFKGTDYRMIGHRSDHIYHITHIDVSLSAYSHGS